MDFKIKVNVDTGEAIEKLERIKSLYEEINNRVTKRKSCCKRNS